MAHVLEGYDGPCSEIHGHSYRLFVTVAGTPSEDAADPKYGMVIDFGILKRIVGEHIVGVYDHSLLIRRTEENAKLIEMLASRFEKMQAVDFQPTCENLASLFAGIIGPLLPQGTELHSIRLHETATSYAEWFACDNP